MTWRLERDISGFPVRRSDEVSRRYREAGYWTDETLTDYARLRVREDPSKALVVEKDRSLTRGEAWDQALRLAAFFKSRRLEPGDTISFQLPNWAESVPLSLAARMCGLVINPIQPIYRDSEVSYILGDCRSKMVFIPQIFRGYDYPALISRLRPQLPELREVVVLRGAADNATAWEETISRPRLPEGDLPKVDPAAVMMAMYTSGTTSRPKGVLHSHQTYGFKLKQMAQVWGLKPSDILLMPSPISHITGLFWTFDAPWMLGLTNILMDVWSAEEALQNVERHACTVIGGVTPFLQQLLETAEHRPDFLGSLRMFFCGGTTVPPELMRRATAAKPDCLFIRAYGCSETPTTSMGSDRSTLETRTETDGEIFPPTEVRFVSPEGDGDVPDGEEGEILVRGPEQFLGYLHEEDNAGLFDDEGYFRTGDLGRLVEGRHVVITGRKKDIIIRAGENISPKEIEDILYQHPDIEDVAIVAMPSRTTGEKGCAFVVARNAAVVDLESIRRFLETAGVARQKFPEHVVTVPELPRVPAGKVRKDALRDEARKIFKALEA